jgi:hypothetical protein
MSIIFDIDDLVSVDGLVTSLATDTTGTISHWVNITTDDGLEHVSFSISRDSSSVRTDFFINIDLRAGQDFVTIGLDTDDVIQWSASTPTNSTDAHIGKWLNITVTQDGVEPKMYFNGVLQTLSFTTSTDKTKWFKAILTDATNKADTANIGTLELNGSNVVGFKGEISELFICSTVLSLPKIEQLSKHVKGIPYLATSSSNNRAYYGMSDKPHGTSADGITVRDLFNNGNDGTGDNGPNNLDLIFQAENFLVNRKRSNDFIETLLPSLGRNFNGGFNNSLGGRFA